MALFTASIVELRQDQIYKVLIFMESKIIKKFNFQQKNTIFLIFYGE